MFGQMPTISSPRHETRYVTPSVVSATVAGGRSYSTVAGAWNAVGPCGRGSGARRYRSLSDGRQHAFEEPEVVGGGVPWVVRR